MEQSDPGRERETRQISASVEETERIAGQLAADLKPGDCISLEGQLGAGKTQFVRGLAIALGVDRRAVSSPTYVLLNIYRGNGMTLYHLDAYRANGPEDFESIGFSELLEQKGVVVVEWGRRVRDILPVKRIEVDIEVKSETERVIVIRRTEETI